MISELGAAFRRKGLRRPRTKSWVRLAASILYKRLRRRILLARALWAARHHNPARYPTRAQRPHGLPGRLFITLTSYPPRFPTLHLTLRSLIDQTVKPDGIILWIAHQDLERLPPEVRALTTRGLSIRTCDDIGSFKKLVCALEAYPEAFLVTADDDLYYPPHWLATLTDSFDPSQPSVLAHRAHRIKWQTKNSVAPYADWQKQVQDPASRAPSTDIVPTTGAGALFFPSCFSSEVTNRQLFQSLCPEADDLWFYWMTRRAGTSHRKVGENLPLITWPASQDESLFSRNGTGGNDRQIALLLTSLGRPDPSSKAPQSDSPASTKLRDHADDA